jgi:hypothetical protein
MRKVRYRIAFHAASPKSYCSVPSIDSTCTATQLADIFVAQKPVVFKDLKILKPGRVWTLSSLKSLLSSTRIQVEAYGDYMSPRMKMITLNFGQFIDYIQSGKKEHFFLAQRQLKDFPLLEEDLIVPHLCQQGKGHLYM